MTPSVYGGLSLQCSKFLCCAPWYPPISVTLKKLELFSSTTSNLHVPHHLPHTLETALRNNRSTTGSHVSHYGWA